MVIQRKTPKFFSCSLALQERVNNIAQAEISSATSDDCNCIERRLHLKAINDDRFQNFNRKIMYDSLGSDKPVRSR